MFIVLLLGSFSLIHSQNSDPASLDVYAASSTITVDGQLNEADWSSAAEKPHLMFKVNGTPSGNYNTPTNAGLIVKGDYREMSTTYVKFLHQGMDLYVSLQSDDQQVCKFDWEGDGLFMQFKNAADQTCELKLYVINNTTFGAEGGGATPGDGYAGTGIVNGTIFDSTDTDNGYTAEGVLHLDKFGWSSLPASIQVSVVIFDPDHYSVPGNPWGDNGNFAKQWWGSEWGSEFRTLNLVNTVVPVELSSFSAAAVPGGVKLNWVTATEKNNRGFEIERSIDNKTFVNIAFVDGKGTTTSQTEYSYVDKNSFGTTYYRLKQIDFDGAFEYSKVVEVNSLADLKYDLEQNYPNPFNPTTTISYSIPENSFVTIKVFDVLGNEVASLVNEEMETGRHKIDFNAANLSSGVYYYSITAGNFTASKKFILMK
jgi:hypothetical protein